MTDPLLLGGLAIACFVAYNIGGSSTGPAFAPAVGADVVGKATAAALMSVFFFAGAWTIGRRVVDTLGTGLVEDPSLFTLPVSIVVLFFIGTALLVGNVSGAPASTLMTAVGAIAGVAFARGGGFLAWEVVTEIVAWWLLSPVVGFWISVMVGRYFYPHIDRVVAIDQSEGPLLTLERASVLPRPAPGPNTTRRELVGSTVVVGIGCLMAFSSGTSNIANAIAPLVGSGELGMDLGIVVGSAAVAVGAFTIARRTMETLGSDITDLPLTAAIVVAVVASTIVTVLSSIGIPASFVIVSTMCIVGLGWGRATRTIAVGDAIRGTGSPSISVGALTADETSPTVGDPTLEEAGPRGEVAERIGDEATTEVPAASELFDPETTVRVVAMQHVVPLFATVSAYLAVRILPFV